MKSNKRIVIASHAGGLGDTLLFSTLPEALTEEGYDVFISTHVKIRNSEVNDLVWARNPYVKGFTDEPPFHPGGGWYTDHLRYVHLCKRTHPIAANESIYNVATNRNTPYVKYHRLTLQDHSLFGKVVFDPTSISQGFTTRQVLDFRSYLANDVFEIPENEIVFVDSKLYPNPFGFQTYRVADIYEYCDIIKDARAFCTVQSGGSVLASALRNDGMIYTLTEKKAFNDKLFIFPNANYVVTSQGSPDYHIR